MADSVNAENWFAANIENWYSPIQEHTFPTYFIPLTLPRAQAIIDAYRFLNPEDDNPSPAPLDANTQQVLKEMEDEIDSIIQSKNLKSKGVFIKLSCRSPKDSACISPKFKSTYQAKLANFLSEHNNVATQNDKLIMLYQSLGEAMKVTNGAEAFSLLNSSERISSDLQLYVNDLKKKGEHVSATMNIILREWVDLKFQYEYVLF